MIQKNKKTGGQKLKGEPIPSNISYGKGLEVKLAQSKPAANGREFLDKNPSVQPAVGKNIHFFESRDGRTFLEVWPHSKHTYAEVNLLFGSFSTFGDYKLEHSSLYETTNSYEGGSHDGEQRFSVKGPQNRGTGCCADMILSDTRQMKLGISHFVVRPLTYLHQFYIFAPEEPFQVVAVSDPFCLGQARESDLNSMDHWLSSTAHSFQKRMTKIIQDENVDIYDCPELTFATGISNKIGHDDKYIIISYGVDDCYSRSMVVHKDKIEMMLFPPRSCDGQNVPDCSKKSTEGQEYCSVVCF